MKAVTGTILWADLGSETVTAIPVPDAVYQKLLSGVGLGAWVLNRAIPVDADPLGPDNVIGFTTGMLCSSGSVVTGRWMAMTKSPLTGGWGDANCGGNLAPAMRRCGYDAVFVSGVAERPVYLMVERDGGRILPADDLWGVDAVETERRLVERHAATPAPAAAVIGSAGEARSLIAGIVNDGGRIAARSGVGAVMGSKRLKALVCAGGPGGFKAEIADRKAVAAITREFGAKVAKVSLPRLISGAVLPLVGRLLGALPTSVALDGILTMSVFKRWGTIFNNTTGVTSGDSPLMNWRGSVRDFRRRSFRRINPDRIVAREREKYSCASCVIGCGGICDIGDVPGSEFKETHKPEYETVMAFSGLVLNRDLDSIYVINEILNRAGMDSISAGGAVAFAINAFEEGVLTPDAVDGLDLHWGNSDAIVALVRKMVVRDGIGDLLADGARRAAERIGGDAAALAVEVGGQEPGMHDPRFDPLMGVHFVADPTPGRHTVGSGLYYNMLQLWQRVSWAPRVTHHPKKDEYVASETEALKGVASTCYKQLVDGAGGCLFAAISGVQHWRLFDWLNAATGWELTGDDYMEIGRRMQTLRQLFIVRHGVDPRSRVLHARMAAPLEKGPTRGRAAPVTDMVRLHWHHFGWNGETGVPTEETLSRLGIHELLSIDANLPGA